MESKPEWRRKGEAKVEPVFRLLEYMESIDDLLVKYPSEDFERFYIFLRISKATIKGTMRILDGLNQTEGYLYNYFREEFENWCDLLYTEVGKNI